MSMQNQEVSGRTPSSSLASVSVCESANSLATRTRHVANISRVELPSRIPQSNIWTSNVLSHWSCLAHIAEQDFSKAMQKFFRMISAPAVQTWDSQVCKARESFFSSIRKMPENTSQFLCSKPCSCSPIIGIAGLLPLALCFHIEP